MRFIQLLFHMLKALALLNVTDRYGSDLDVLQTSVINPYTIYRRDLQTSAAFVRPYS